MIRCGSRHEGWVCTLQGGHKGDHRAGVGNNEFVCSWPNFEKKLARSPFVGRGGAPTRCTTLPEDPKERKTYPVASGFTDYFPDAIAAISHLSFVANEHHNPGEPVHWARSKSTDEADTLLRHFLQRGTVDTDGIRHSVKMAWRALALLQKEIESKCTGPAVTDERTQERGTDEIYQGACARDTVRESNSGR